MANSKKNLFVLLLLIGGYAILHKKKTGSVKAGDVEGEFCTDENGVFCLDQKRIGCNCNGSGENSGEDSGSGIYPPPPPVKGEDNGEDSGSGIYPPPPPIKGEDGGGDMPVDEGHYETVCNQVWIPNKTNDELIRFSRQVATKENGRLGSSVLVI